MKGYLKAVFIHDHRFRRSASGGHFSEGKLGYTVFERYLKHFDEILVVSRMTDISSESESEFVSSDGPNVSFSPLLGEGWFDVFFKNFFINFQVFRKTAAECDFFILRVPSVLSVLFLPFLLMSKKKYIVEVVGDARESIFHSIGKRFFRGAVSSVFYWITRIIVARASGAIYVTKFYLQDIYPNKSVTEFSSNVEINEVSLDVLHARKSRIFSLDGSDFCVGIIASYNNLYKGIPDLLKAVGYLRDRYDVNIKVRLLGSGSASVASDLLKSYGAEGWFFMDGSLSSDSVPAWLDNVDVYCQPSLTEGLPRALVEAMSRGCPCIGSDVGGIPELLNPNSLVPPGDAIMLSEKIYHFISSKEVLSQESARNFYAAKEYTKVILDKRRSSFFIKVVGQ